MQRLSLDARIEPLSAIEAFPPLRDVSVLDVLQKQTPAAEMENTS